MSVLSVLSGAATAGGKAFEGYGLDQRTAAANLLAQRKAADEETRNRVLNLTALAGIDPDVQGRIAGSRAAAEVAPHVSEVAQEAPIHTQQAVATAQGTAPITEGVHATERRFDNANQPPDKPSVTVQQPLTPGDPAQAVVIDPSDPRHPKVSVAPIPGVTKGGAAGGGSQSGLTLQTMARMGMSANDLRTSIKEMAAYENDPGNLAKLTPAKQALGATAEVVPNQEAHGLAGVISNGAGAFISGAAQQHIAQSDPAYRQYLYNKQRVGTAFTELLPRPNQQLLGIEKGLSGVDVGWSPALLKDVQARRQAGLDMLEKILSGTSLGAQGGSGSASPGGTPDHTAMTDEQFAAAWKAGKFRKP